ncbi:A disintegrin and metalloproteinase with thrombospondin motifs 18-like [Actinia tenebrosa]|uniref:A disintegrin and metalloproteinase with thrombospondin motifs 18-like n=1 Tax=Actinia tenebrosa TaxID=6105 RepID=A0A6P8I2Q5_ACTTE|nr:A disintegrin and metalloproteinase with thrombospondin motifs 18-like [Actinia tenebrosa]XP_031559183.1 A disintegrin and metalloproteinase with thrombospondin motifs 18-like [Actinia tenebrosa]
MFIQPRVLLSWCWIFSVCVCQTEGKTKPDLHQHMTQRELQKFFGVNSHQEVPDYDIAHSYSVDSPRAKRSSESSRLYKLKAFGSSMDLNLELDPSVKSPHFVVHSYEEDGSRVDSTIDDVKLYTGHVEGHPGSRVALKENNGLSGLISLNDKAFFVTPLTERLARAYGYNGDGQPHLVYRQPKDKAITDFQDLLNDEHSQSSEAGFKVLEMTLVADEFLINVYEKETAEHLLMIAHIARSLYLDHTIGPIKINIVVVGVVLKKDGLGYDSSASSLTRLGALGDWCQKNLPTLDTDPGHPDTVVLISKNIAGRALSSSTCFYTFGKAAVGDIGPATGAIVAHETAHTFGVLHDGEMQNPLCPGHKYIMSYASASGPDAYKWSVCSKEKIQAFLRSSDSSCLDDEPDRSVESHYAVKYINKLPGDALDRDIQCKMMFNTRYFACPMKSNECSSLWCSHSKSGPYCEHMRIPPVDGTACGPRHWCIKGICEDNGSPIIDGMWSGWSATYTRCSKECGIGLQWRTRTCTNPSPKNGGKDCPGSAEGRWKLCNTQDCPQGTMDYRLEQCKAIDPKFDGVHYYDKEPCILKCKIGHYIWNKGVVKDGTRCYNDHTDKSVCIKGRCRVAACDESLDIGIKYDRCHVCDGDSSSCGKLIGLFDAPCIGHGPDHECTVISVPVGATNVNVEKKLADGNAILAIRDGNGQIITPHFPSPTTVVDFKGTRVYYYYQEPRDRVFIPGPTTIALSIVNIPLYNKPNSGVEYSMFLKNMTTVVLPSDAEWKTAEWSSCTRTCAGGTQVRAVECVRKDDKSHLGTYVCESNARMPAAVQVCNQQACPQSWYKSNWSPCSKTCGKGLQTREIICRQEISKQKYKTLPDSSCSGEKPTGDLRKDCNKVGCPLEWVPTPWSKCSTTCGVGAMTRKLTCMRRTSEGDVIQLHHLMCNDIPRLKTPTVKPCEQLPPCPTVSPTISVTPSIYQPLGCYKDDKPNAMPNLVINLRDSIDWSNLNKTIDACANYVHKYYPEYKVFGVQFYGECWTGLGAENTYMKYGAAENCYKGVGAKHSIYVYKLRSK